MAALAAWLAGAYLWLKAAHVVFVIFWMAGLFMLPRFLVYHQEATAGSAEAAAWASRERRLLSIIMNPSLVAVWTLGLALAWSMGFASQHWFHAKFACVLILTLFHGWLALYTARLAEGGRRVSGRSLRLLNELPSLMTIAIVILVIAKPF